MKIIKGSEKGFFAITNDVARHISHCIKNNQQWHVKWGAETLYYDGEYGNNVWEYYFKQIYPYEPSTDIVSDYIDLILLKDNSFRSTMNYIFSNFIILNDKTQESIAPFYSFFENNKVLGVHIRRTDKFLVGNMHGPENAPVDLSIFKKEIDNVIMDYDAIYLATDCIDACNYIKDIYGKKVLFNKNAFRSRGSEAIHSSCKTISGYNKGFDVLCDSILLSKCQHLIASTSNVSVTSLYLNTNITYLNVNEKYLGDKNHLSVI